MEIEIYMLLAAAVVIFLSILLSLLLKSTSHMYTIKRSWNRFRGTIDLIRLVAYLGRIKRSESKSSSSHNMKGQKDGNEDVGFLHYWKERVRASPDTKFLIDASCCSSYSSDNANDGNVNSISSVTFSEADQLSNQMANVAWKHFIHHVGGTSDIHMNMTANNNKVQQRQTVVCLLPNSCFFVCCWLGLIKVGITAALVNINLRGKSLAHAIEVAFRSNVNITGDVDGDAPQQMKQKCKCVVIVDASLLNFLVDDDAARRVLKKYHVEVYVFGGRPACIHTAARTAGDSEKSLHTNYNNLQTLLDASPKAHPKYASLSSSWCDDDDYSSAVLCIYTSGTTGYPKAAKISHRRLIRAGTPLSSLARLKSGDVIYAPLPLYHSNAGLIGVSSCVIAGVSMVIRDKFSVSNFASDVAQFRCAVFIYIGDLARYIVNSNRLEDQMVCRTLRVAFGNGMRGDVWSVFQSRYNIGRIIEFYSSTEGNVTMFNTCGVIGAIGFIPPLLRRVSPATLVKVNEGGEIERDPTTGMAILSKVGEPGQLIGKISEQRRFDGYTDKAATQQKILNDILEKGDRWFATGDLIRESKTDAGVYFWVDRLGDTFRWKGENVSTTEVEHILITAGNDVIDVAVYGVEIPNRSDGRAGMAMLTLNNRQNFDLRAFYEEISSQLQTFAIPVFLRIIGPGTDYRNPTTPLEENNAMTSTFKKKKAILKAEGFNPRKIQNGDQLYFFDKGKCNYVDLSYEVYDMICGGEIKL